MTAPLLSLSPLLPAVHLVVAWLLGGWTLLFLFRIVLTWYPQLDLRQGALRLIGWPTEGLLVITRRLIPPIGGIDVTPVVWVGLISLLRELVVGQQGLLTLALLRSQALT